jgi:phosphatidylglycerol:prolipoprotein diacylglycerol transferase
MYIFAFATAYFAFRRQVRERRFPMDDDTLLSMFGWCILGLVAGARIFYCLVYDTSGYYRAKPWLIFWPFHDGHFTGLAGMSYHGGVIGGLLCIIIWSLVRKYDLREIGDMYAASIPLGYTFGRLGNFINGELYGRVTALPWAMLFPTAVGVPANSQWAGTMAAANNIPLPASGLVNLPRHPSQLYEALFEGLALWLILWAVRKKKPFKGFLTGLYLVGYGMIRFMLEYFREPDLDLGYRFQITPTNLPLAEAHPLLSFSTGQVFCAAMVLCGLVFIAIMSRLPNRENVYVYPEAPLGKTAEEKRRERNERRRLKKKLR